MHFSFPFAPYSNPEIAVTVNIPYGYAGTNAASLGKQIYEYYYGYTSFEEIVGSGALSASNSSVEEMISCRRRVIICKTGSSLKQPGRHDCAAGSKSPFEELLPLLQKI